MIKPVLIGMCNPHSSRPQDALAPRPANSAGARVLAMIQEVDPTVTERQYLRAFDRQNLLPGRVWDKLEAYRVGPRRRQELDGRLVVVLGRDVWFALGLGIEEGSWKFLPHPSGLNRWYNEKRNRIAAGTLLRHLMEQSR